MRKKKESEYHTGRLNISCPPSVKDRIAVDATEQGLSISQFILQLYDKSTQAGSSEHLARMGLDMVGLKKRLVDSAVLDDLARLKALETELDETLRETVDAVKRLKAEGK